MKSAVVLLVLMLAGWFSAVAIIENAKLSLPSQVERLHRGF